MGNTNHKDKQKDSDDSVFSKNHSKSVKYRERKAEEKEAEKEINDYLKDNPGKSDRVY